MTTDRDRRPAVTPGTEAGRRLAEGFPDLPSMSADILAIEAEARAQQAEYDFVSGPGIPPHQCDFTEARAEVLAEVRKGVEAAWNEWGDLSVTNNRGEVIDGIPADCKRFVAAITAYLDTLSDGGPK